ncbi:MAG: family 20 glycosylhydrolase [Bacteroidales bacterium]|nr:family 20 glycosylhydrolase [Bacteroidales bacterium]
MKRWHPLLALALLLLTAACGDNIEITDYSIIPEPVYMVQKGRSFTVTSSTKLCFENLGQNNPTAKYIANTLRHMHVRPAFIGTPHKNCITFAINDTLNPALGDEGYLLQVHPDGIFVSANTEAGLFYAFQTFVQMLPDDILHQSYSRIVMPECTILDYPRFSWRGSHLDVCRHFFSVKQIKRHLDLMATYKLNRFHWHLTDDQGWRIEIDQYPQLNDIGSWRVDRTQQPWGYEQPPRPGEEPTYGGFYTQKEIAEIVEYAAQRHIEVIPEIDLPGHASAILASYPELACDNYPYTVAIGPYWPPKAVLCVGNDKSIQFVSDIIEEVATLFPSEYIHIGGDVAYKDNWEHCPKCQARIHRQGLADENALHGWFLTQVSDMLARKGKRLIGWDDIMDFPLDSDAVIMAWRGDTTAFASALLGHAVISANPSYCNLECYQADSNCQPTAFPQYLLLHHAYHYDPIPPTLTERAQPYILGGECMLWTDYTTSYDQAEYQLLPRLCAIAECLWTPREQKDWPHFQQKIEHHKTRLHLSGHKVCPGSFKPIVTKTADSEGLLITITTEVYGSYVYYTTDGSAPTPDSPLYTAPIHLTKGTLLRTLTLYNGQAQEEVYDFLI